MATVVENLKMELLIQALYDTGNGDKVEEVNRKVIDYITKGKTVGSSKKEKS